MKKIITLLTSAAIFFDLFSPLRLYFEGGKALMMLLPVLLIILYDRLFIRKYFLPVALYVIVCFILLACGNEYFKLPYLIQVLFAFSCFEHFLITRDKSFAKIVLLTIYMTIMVTVVISIPLFISMPNLSRIMNHAEEEGIVEPILFWTIQYPTIHALPVYSIPLFYIIKEGKGIILRLLSLVYVIATFILMFFADATTALIVNLIVYAILLLYNSKLSPKANLGRLAVLGLLMLILLNKTIIIEALKIAQPLFEGSSTYKKIDEIILSLSGYGTEGDLEKREDLFKRSLDSFVSNPLFPEMNINNIGSHNFLFDQIVAMGIIPGISFIWFILDRIRRPIKYLSSRSKPYYYVCILVFLLMGFTKNFFLLLPTCCIAPMAFILGEWNVIKKKNNIYVKSNC